MHETHQKVLHYFQNMHRHFDRLCYEDFCIDLDYFNISYPSMVDDVIEIPKFFEDWPRDKSIIYRARENEYYDIVKKGIGRPYKSIEEISIVPDAKKVNIGFGRCNKPREARFYASNDLRASILECLTNGFTKDFSESRGVTLGAWKIIQPLTLARVNYSVESVNKYYHANPDFYMNILNYSRAFNEDSIRKIAEHGGHDVEFAERVLGLFADEFAKTDIENDLDYAISNYYCDNIFDKTNWDNPSEQIDGILYPSVSFAYQEMNLVLHPRAMKKLKFIDASLYWVVHHAIHSDIQFIPMEQMVKADANDILQWRKFKP